MSAIIAKILALEPMKGYDSIELASILGWKVVVRRGEMKVDDLVVYFSISSILPNEGPTAFLGGKRLKTKRFRSYISQGLAMPLGLLGLDDTYEVGMNVTELLRVKKFIPKDESELYENTVNKLPWFELIPKTDEERIQFEFDRWKSCKCTKLAILQKFDGKSNTFVWLVEGDKFMICNRNHRLIIEDNDSKPHYEMARKYDVHEGMRSLGRNLAIQAEIIGPKINGNRHGTSSLTLHVFNIYDIDKCAYLDWAEVKEICEKIGLPTVAEIYHGPAKPEHFDLDFLLNLANAQQLPNGRLCEGIVIKSVEHVPRASFKVISNEYIIKYDL
jgi:RNA ligase (TIGR02306 family)